MLYDHKNELAIIQIPRCGGSAFGAGLKANPESEGDYPHDQDDVERFPTYQRVIVVRPPFERFVSATNWMIQHPELWEDGAEKIAVKGFNAFALWVCTQRKLPDLFKPQMDWIASATMVNMPIFLPRSKMAAWFNHNQAGCLTHRNQSIRGAGVPEWRKIDDNVKEELEMRYYNDFGFLRSQVVWPSSPGDSRRMDTGCKTCGGM